LSAVKQQVNLFLPQFRRQKKQLAARTLAAVFLLVVLALTLLSALQLRQIATLNADLAQATTQKSVAEAELKAMRLRYPARSPSQLLKDELVRLQQVLADNRRLASAMANGEFGDSRGFSAYFEAFARQHVEGTWLTRLAVENGGRSITATGHALQAALVPLYVQQLGSEPVMAGKSFNTLEMQRPETDPLRLDFSISVNPPQAGAASQASLKTSAPGRNRDHG
jgi:hypothetical protein